MLATDLVAHAPAGIEAHPRTQSQLDLREPAQIERALDESRPEWVVNAAAYTAVDRAESERDLAFAVNATAVGSLARACARRGVALVHFGTDYVFPGDGTRPYREDDAVAPVNAYGQSKLAGERAIAESGVRAIVIRTQWLFGAAGKSFPRTMWERASRGERTRVVDDQRGRPTYTVDLAAVTWELVAREALGVFHAANQGAVTWFELAAHVFERAGARDLLSPCSTTDYPTPARRPAFSVLDTSKLERTIGHALPPWTSAVDRFLEEMAGAPVRAAGSPASG